jgi:hypothetical protein
MVSQDWKNLLVTPVISVVCLASVTLIQVFNLSKIKVDAPQELANPLTQIKQEQVSLTLLKKLPDFGYDNLIADWTFLRFLQYFGDSPARKTAGYSLSPDYFEIIVERDPQFTKSYSFLSTSVSIYAGQPEKSVALISKGLKPLSPQDFPEAYYIWIYKANDQLLFLGDIQGAKQSYALASEWASIHPDPQSQSLARSTRQTVDFLSRNPNSKNARVNAWLNVLISTFDQPTRQKAIDNIRALGADVSFSDAGVVTIRFSGKD